MAAETEHATEEPEGLNPRQYILIGLLLAVITAVELAVSYSDIGAVLIPLLIVLSAVKFVIVVAFYMHLRYQSRLFSLMFAAPLILASLVLVALISLFWTDITDAI